MLGNVFKAYDVRGTYPDQLTDKMGWQIGVGSSEFLIGEASADGFTTPMMKNLVVGRDMRLSSPTLAGKLREGIAAQGGNVIDVGLVDTPFVTFAVNHLDCAGGVMVTASHNPPKYNGFKVCKRLGKPVGASTGLDDIRMKAAMADPTKQRGLAATPGRQEERDLWDDYREHVLSFLDMGGKKLKIVVDASNGMAGTMCPKVFGAGGANVEGLEIVELYFENDKGEFVHEPNPLVAANLADLQKRVVEEKADLGVCYDGDADRCMVVDEKGQIVGCDILTAWLASRFLASEKGGSIVYDLRSSKSVEMAVREAGGEPVRSRVGHVFLKQQMAEHDAVFGGELSGHFYFRGNFYADSGAIAMATVLSALAAEGKPLSAAIKPHLRYVQSGEVNFETEDKDGAIDEVEATFMDRGEVDHLDGVTVDCFGKEGWWANVRKSNTEPLLRLNLEARDAATLERAMAEVAPLLGTRVEH